MTHAHAHSQALRGLLASAPVVPVVTIDDPHRAVPLARALARGGLAAMEITLRTAHGLDAIAAVAREVPEIAVGAGTVVTPSLIGEAIDAGARFLVSPGVTARLAEAASRAAVPFLPGCGTVSEAMALAEAGFEILKFFPAEQAGGAKFLDSLRPVLPHLAFCPTGGVGPGNAGAYLKLPNVICVGGSWIAPKETIAAEDFGTIERLAREAAALARG